jgi:hypothetical protein
VSRVLNLFAEWCLVNLVSSEKIFLSLSKYFLNIYDYLERNVWRSGFWMMLSWSTGLLIKWGIGDSTVSLTKMSMGKYIACFVQL